MMVLGGMTTTKGSSMLGAKDNHYEQKPAYLVTARVNDKQRTMAVFADNASHAKVVFLDNLKFEGGELRVEFISVEGEFTKGNE